MVRSAGGRSKSIGSKFLGSLSLSFLRSYQEIARLKFLELHGRSSAAAVGRNCNRSKLQKSRSAATTAQVEVLHRSKFCSCKVEDLDRICWNERLTWWLEEVCVEGEESRIILGKLLEEEILIGFSPRQGFSPGRVPTSRVSCFVIFIHT